jgi:MinD-like ATPase involved in chromosome partitioning or flagellar assembly
MTVVAFTSGKGAPGVTTTVLGLASVWPQVLPERRVLAVEADPAGGDAASGFLSGALDPSRGLLALAAQRGHDPVSTLWGQLVALDDAERTLLLAGLADPTRSAALDGAWTALAEAVVLLRSDAPDLDVLIDLGRLGSAHDPAVLRRVADLVVVVCGSSAPAVVAARAAVQRVREQGVSPVGLLVSGPDRPYPARVVAEECGAPLLGVLPRDDTAQVWSGATQRLKHHARSPLSRALRGLALDLDARRADAMTLGSRA